MDNALDRPARPPSLPPSQASFLEAQIEGVAANLALDEALLEEAHEGVIATPIVRTWMATQPVVVVGSSSRIDQEVDRAACAARGVAIVRRPSGGATVVLGPGCLMWTVVAPYPQGVPALEQVHAGMLEPLCAALARPGIEVARYGTSDIVLMSAGEARKISGNALRVRRHGVLYHGTLLDDFDIDLVGSILKHPPREPAYRAGRPHAAFLANLHLGRPLLEEAVRRAFAADLLRTDWPEARMERLLRERYAVSAWTDRL
jgi:lipoate-protein ligase A